MIPEGFYEKCLREIREKQEPIKDSICSGSLKNGEYEKSCGVLMGLKRSEQILIETFDSFFGSKPRKDNSRI